MSCCGKPGFTKHESKGCCGKELEEPEKTDCREEQAKRANSPQDDNKKSVPGVPTSCGCANATGELTRLDWILHGSLIVIAAALAIHFLGGDLVKGLPRIRAFSHGIWLLLGQMWWGLMFGIVAVGVLERVPRELIAGVLGRGGTPSGILRATAAGLLLDLCNHGILLVAAELYKKGASIGQVVAFLVASPWNSFSVTLVLIGLIGLPWTLVVVVLSLLVALITGLIFDTLQKHGVLPANPNLVELPDGFSFFDAARRAWKAASFSPRSFGEVIKGGLSGSRMILRWLLFGAILAALVQAFVPNEIFQKWFGPTVAGLFLTLLAATLVEVCSEGSVPLAAQLFTRAGAPGNGFVFLIAGASTDLTEMLVLREATRSWKIALALPTVTIPQIVLLGWILNH